MNEATKVADTLVLGWGYIVAISGGIGVLITLCVNLKRITTYIKKRLKERSERKKLPSKTLEAVTTLSDTVGKLKETVEAINNRLSDVEKKVETLSNNVDKLSAETDSQSVMLKHLDSDTADILCSQLTREHDFFMGKGFCPTHDRQRIGEIHRKYKERGRNHIADTLMDDLIKLPISDPTK